MKHQRLLLSFVASLMAITTWADVEINETNFPDENFRSWLKNQSYGSDDVLTEAEIASVTSISMSGSYSSPGTISSLKGIEFFTALETLSCSYNQLTSLDVSKNTALTSLNCYSNQLTSLDLSKNTALTYLYCSYNQLTSLDLSKNTALTSLDCGDNQLTSLDLSKNTQLTELDCHFNTRLSSLDLSQNTALTSLDCSDTQLTSLDLSKNTALTWLACSSSSLSSLDLSQNTALTSLSLSGSTFRSLDLSKNTKLLYLACINNHFLTSLDLSKNTALTKLECRDNHLISLDVSGCTALTELRCYNNDLTSLDISNNTTLTYLDCSYNQLTSLDVSKNTTLASFSCSNNQFTSLEVSKNTALTSLSCYSNQISGEGMDALIASLPEVSNGELKIIYNYNEGNEMSTTQATAAKAKGWIPQIYDSNSYSWIEYAGTDVDPALLEKFPDANFRQYLLSQQYGVDGVITDEELATITRINVSYRNIKTLKGIEYFTSLQHLDCANNQIETLDLTKNTQLTELDCHNNQISSLDVSKNTALTTLLCGDNPLAALEIHKNTALTRLDCSNYGINKLTSLDVSGCTALENLACANNQLTSLDVSQNTALTELICYSNKLAALDVSVCTALTRLNCYENQLTTLDLSKNTKLTELSCEENNLTSLDISGCTALTNIECYSNQLTSLDVSKNTALTELICYSNKLAALDVSVCTALTRLNCYENQLTTLDLSKNTALKSLNCYSNQLTSLNVSGCMALTSLNCYSNQIKGEAMGTFIENLPTITSENSGDGEMYIVYYENEGNEMTSKQVETAKSKGWKPKYAVAEYNWLNYEGCDIIPEGIEINETNFPDENFRNFLKEQGYGTDGVLTSAELSTITSLSVTWKNIKDLKGIEFFTSMTSLYCYNNQLTSLDLSKNTALRSLDCTGNQLTSLDLSKNTALTNLYCYSNRIKGEAMDALIASLPTITSSSYDGRMQVIDNSSERNMMTIDQVAAAKAKGWTPLYKAGSGYSDWKEYAGYDPSKVIEINETTFPDEGFRNWLLSQSYGEDGILTDTEILTTSMYIYSSYDSKIQSLKGIEYFTELTALSCSSNQLTSLDLSKNTKLTSLSCYQNQISGEGMDALIASLPEVSNGELKIIYNYNEGNEMSTAQAAAAKAKGWIPQAYVSDGSYYYEWKEYAGMDVDPALLEKFPDSRFRGYLLSQPYGTDGVITDEELATVTSIDVSNMNIKSLKGIEYFTALQHLECDNNQLTELDLSKNTKLTFLNCYKNQLSSLDLSKNTLLSDIDCSDNQLTSVNLSGCKNLVEVGFSNNQLTSLDLSGCKDLVEFGCHDNQLSSLNLSGCTSLDRLNCYNNQFKGAAMDALIASLPTVPMGTMRVLDSYELYKMLGYDVEGVEGVGGNEMTLEQVVAAKAKGWIPYYSSYSTSSYGWIEYIPNDPSGIGIAIDETNFPDEKFRNMILSTSYGYDKVLTGLEASMVNTISAEYSNIQSLKGIEYFTELKQLKCYKNQLTSLDLSKNTKLTYLGCGNNQLTVLDVSNNTALIELECDNNQLTSLDLSKSTALTGLSCTKNQISSLDVSKNTALTYINCYSNQMSSLNLPHNSDLVRVRCYDNQLTSLDISNNPALKRVDCYNNKLASINVSGCTALTSLYCYQNQLKGSNMDAIIENLPVVNEGAGMYAIYNEGEGNVMTKKQVYAAWEKGWMPMYYDKSDYGYNTWMSYPGSDDDVLLGDANGDGEIGMPDVMFIVNYILGTPDASFDAEAADANQDGEVGMPDVMFIVNYILNGKFPEE